MAEQGLSVAIHKSESMTFREGVERMVDRATLAAGLDPNTARIIKASSAVLQVRFPVKVRGGVEVFTACRPKAVCALLPTSTRTKPRRCRP
jgi:hypothetical protein